MASPILCKCKKNYAKFGIPTEPAPICQDCFDKYMRSKGLPVTPREKAKPIWGKKPFDTSEWKPKH